MKKMILMLAAGLLSLAGMAQSRSCQLNVTVVSVPGDDLTGQTVVVTQTDYQVGYGTLTLDADGKCSVKVYPGNHLVTVERDGFENAEETFSVEESASEKEVTVQLREKTRDPFALEAEVSHDPRDGRNSVGFSWNNTQPVFFDDFESYDPFAITFGYWTGIDGDLEPTAAMVGSYPNRGLPQYCTIVNPLTVVPTWWYDYPVLRPYAGQQYAGFIRTSSGNSNDDWLISPAITVGEENVLAFKAKAADRYEERFMVYVTEVTDNPDRDDFIRIDAGNYESVDYKEWHDMQYDLSAYAGKSVKLAIRYIGNANSYGSFMLMVDDFYVGPEQKKAEAVARRVARGASNPNERFRVYLDGEVKAESVEGNSYLFEDVAAGEHTLGVQAVYLQGESAVTSIDVTVPSGPFAKVDFEVSADSYLPPYSVEISLVNMESGEAMTLVTSECKASLASLPHGKYALHTDEGAYEEYNAEVEVEGDRSVEILLADRIIDPFNISATEGEDGSVTLRWNQEHLFSDSFEDYDDFATGEFGEWRSVDVDGQPVYPIALGNQNNLISFPGSGNPTNPTAIAPMVFNPWNTEPAMLPTDQAIAAPTGDKTVVFFSAQRAQSDKWLISPLVDIHDGYQMSVKAKAYSSMYPEEMEFCVSEEGSTNPVDFTAVAQSGSVPSENWVLYSVPLDEYVGRKVRLGIHYKSYDAFLLQVDDFTVGPEDGQGETVDYGNVVRYDIWLDGEQYGSTSAPEFTFSGLAAGQHTAGIEAVYKNGASQRVEYTFGVSSVAEIELDPAAASEAYDLLGCRVDAAKASGVTIVRHGDKFIKQIRK